MIFTTGNYIGHEILRDQAKFLGAVSNKKIIATNVQESDAGRPWENGGPAPEVKIKTTRIVAS